MQLPDPRPEDFFKFSSPFWRIVLSLLCALMAGLGIGAAIYRFPEIGWRILVVCLPAASAFFATGYSIANHGTVTHLAAWFWWVTFTIAFADVITRTVHHKIDDPFLDLVSNAIYVLFCTLYLWGTRRKASSPGTSAQ
jgi:hypothetical protein